MRELNKVCVRPSVSTNFFGDKFYTALEPVSKSVS